MSDRPSNGRISEADHNREGLSDWKLLRERKEVESCRSAAWCSGCLMVDPKGSIGRCSGAGQYCLGFGRNSVGSKAT